MASDSRDFFIGRQFDLKKQEMSDTPVEYDPADLTTHGIITGMTGSGKTGLGVAMLEEAARKKIPAIIIDPKGDLTNLLLHFPELTPSDFKPWLDQDEIKRSGDSLEDSAEKTASLWKNGLKDWGLGKSEIASINENVNFQILTPGSTSGSPVNVISSFESPDLPWEENAELLRERISSIVTGLLGLIGIDEVDPLRSREHILLSNLLENAWSNGKSVDLMDLITQVQDPPIEKLGAFPVNKFFPADDRMELAMLLNNFLASPSFQSWRSGISLDIERLLFGDDGKPRHNIFYIAHLNDTERMFFVTLLFASIESWMRTQRGTETLRALIYFDEIMGYLPPVRNPSSRPILLRMLKQARAFGVGLLLATQNPVDVDYKALSNAGTWMIGRLQTERDKERLLDGLVSSTGALDRKTIEPLISSLGKRVFLLHNVHEKKPVIFHTRWVMNYLAGPMTRTQIPALNELPGVDLIGESDGSVKKVEKKAAESEGVTSEAPKLLPNLTASYLPVQMGVKEAATEFRLTGAPETAGIRYRPALFARAEVRFYSRKYGYEGARFFDELVEDLDQKTINWSEYVLDEGVLDDLDRSPLPNTVFEEPSGILLKESQLKQQEKKIIDWLYRDAKLELKVQEKLDLVFGPEETEEEIEKACEKAVQKLLEEEQEKIEHDYEKKITRLLQKISRQEMEVEEQKDELDQRKLEEIGTHGEFLLSLFSKRKKSVSNSLTKRRMTEKAKMDLEQEKRDLEILQEQLDQLKKEKEDQIRDLEENWNEEKENLTVVPVKPYKKDIFLSTFGVLWLPYYQVEVDRGTRVIPAFSFRK